MSSLSSPSCGESDIAALRRCPPSRSTAPVRSPSLKPSPTNRRIALARRGNPMRSSGCRVTQVDKCVLRVSRKLHPCGLVKNNRRYEERHRPRCRSARLAFVGCSKPGQDHCDERWIQKARLDSRAIRPITHGCEPSNKSSSFWRNSGCHPIELSSAS